MSDVDTKSTILVKIKNVAVKCLEAIGFYKRKALNDRISDIENSITIIYENMETIAQDMYDIWSTINDESNIEEFESNEDNNLIEKYENCDNNKEFTFESEE